MNPLLISLAHSLWQAGLLWLLAWLALRCLPARFAALRYRLALGALALAMLAWLGTWAMLRNQADVSSMMPLASVPERLAGAMESIRENTVHGTSATSSRWTWLWSWVPSWSWKEGLQLAWGVGVFLGFRRIARACASAKQLRREAAPLEDKEWLVELGRTMIMLGSRAKIQLLRSEAIATPVVAGWWRPVIIVPTALVTGVPPDIMRAALAHEVAHVVRWDGLINLLQMGTEALLFFNPFIWLLNRTVREEREACCDAMATRWSGGPAKYSEALVWWTRTAGGMTPAPAGTLAMQGAGDWLRERVHRLLHPKSIPRLRSGWGGARGTTLMVGLFFAITAGGIHFTVAQLSARHRMDLIDHVTAPYQNHGSKVMLASANGLREFSGVVVNEEGKLVPGAEWSVRWIPDVKTRHGRTDAAGRFAGSIENGAVPLRLRLRAEGHAMVLLTFEQTGSMKDLRIVMNRGVDFAVRCRDEAGAPVAGVLTSLEYSEGLGFSRGTSDAEGMVRFSHLPDQQMGTLKFFAPDYQAHRVDRVRIDPKGPPTDIMLKKAEPVEVVFVDEMDGSPVKDVTCRNIEMSPRTDNSAWPALGKPDAEGRLVLRGLNPDMTYSLKAEAGSRGTIFTVNSTKQKKLEVRVPRERRLKLRVINLPASAASPLKIQYGQDESSHGGGTAHYAAAHVQDGTLEFLLGGFMPTARVDIFLLRQWFHSPVLEAETTEYVIAYAKDGRAPDARVAVSLDPGRGARPIGTMFLNWNTPDMRGNWDGLSVPVKDGLVEFSLPRGAKMKFRSGSLLGGRVDDEEKEYVVSADPTELTVPVTPAGVIRAKVLDASGVLARVNQVSAHRLSWRKSKAEELNAPLNGQTREWYVSGPVAFGDSFEVFASQGLQMAVSPAFKMRESQPVQDVVLQFAPPVSHRVTVSDGSGQPVPGLEFIASYKAGSSGHEASARVQSDNNGQVVLNFAPEQAEGEFKLRAWSGPYVPLPAPVDVAGGQATFTLKRGREVRGRFVDRATGNGVRGVEIYWSAGEGRFSSPLIISDDEGRFEFLNAPAEDVFLNIRTPLGRPEGKNWKGDLYNKPGQGESVFYLE